VYRLIVCDLDGTLRAFGCQVRPAIRDSMRAIVDAGAWITIGTGRGLQTLKAHLGTVVVNAPLICCNGGLILDPSTHEVLRVCPTPLALAHEIIRLVQKKHWGMMIYLDDMETLLLQRSSEPGFGLRQDEATVRPVPDPIAELTRPPHKVYVYTRSPQNTPEATELLKEHIGDRARIVAAGSRGLEVIIPGVSKARAMVWLAERLGVTREETLAIGDADNDIEMLEWAGLGIAMGNAMPWVKTAADWTAPTVEEDGVAVALRRFVLHL